MKRIYMSAIAIALVLCAESQIQARPPLIARGEFEKAVQEVQELRDQAREYGVMSGSFFEAKQQAIAKVREIYPAALAELESEKKELEDQAREYGVMSGSYFEAKQEINNKIQQLKNQLEEYTK